MLTVARVPCFGYNFLYWALGDDEILPQLSENAQLIVGGWQLSVGRKRNLNY